MQTSITNPAALIDDLRKTIRGSVLAPDDPGYDAARVVVLGGVDPHPAVIVKVADAADVATAIRAARDGGLELAVRSGGHSGAAHSTADGGLVIDVRDLTSLDIDVEGKTAWAGSGLTAGEYSTAAAAHGLATGFGDTASVGLGGITLGGGVGYLGRKFGLTIDNLLAAEIVTAGGSILEVDANDHPDLFWAIRGGGGNFGVATRFKYRLVDLPEFTGGMLLLPATPETIAGFIAAAEAAPEELSTIANIMPTPPMPFVPESEHGKVAIMAMMAFAGPPDAASRALAPFRALATPIADMVNPMPYPGIYGPEPEGEYHPLAIAHTMFIDHVDLPVAQTIVDHLDASDAAMKVAQLRVLGGAIARVPPDATAYAHRSGRIMVNLASFFEGPDDKPIRQAWVDEFARLLDQGDDAVYVNFLADEGPERVRAAYPDGTWERLAAIKARYDPTNLFRLNQNVPPAGAGRVE